MHSGTRCAECGANWQDGESCENDFHQMLYWENELPELGEVHHLMVLCYYLQHPSQYSTEGLTASLRLLSDFLDQGLSPLEARQKNRQIVDSGNRSWKIKATPTSIGSYARTVQWRMTARDVVARGADQYRENVRAWARIVLDDLKASGNFTG